MVTPTTQPTRLGLPPPTVLLVEDHADTRDLYAFDLRHSGFRVQEVASTTEAMAAIAASIPDVVVADLHLRDTGGLQLCHTLKQSPRTRDVPIIAVTTSPTAESVRVAHEAGCAALLMKPCLPAEMRTEIDRVLTAARQARQRADAALERAHALTRKSAILKVKAERVQARVAQQLADDVDWSRTLARVRAEFQEMPGLQLTDAQAARLLGLDRATACRLLTRLEAEGFLRRSHSDIYLRAV